MNQLVWWGGLTVGMMFWAAMLYWFGWWPLLAFFLGCAVLAGVR